MTNHFLKMHNPGGKLMQSYASLRKVIFALFLIITPIVQGGGCHSTGNVRVHNEGSGNVNVDVAFDVTYETVVVTSPRSQLKTHFLDNLPKTVDDSLTNYINTFLKILQRGIDERVRDGGALKALINTITPYYNMLILPSMTDAAKYDVLDLLIADVQQDTRRSTSTRK